MKTGRIAKVLCSLFVIVMALAPGALAEVPSSEGPVAIALPAQQTAKVLATDSTSDDPIGDWLEKNAARYGLYIERTPRPKDLNARLKLAPSGRVPTPVAAAPPASSSPPSASAGESDAIQAFVVNRLLVDLPAATNQSEPFSVVPMIPSSPPVSPSLSPSLSPSEVPEESIDKKVFAPPADAVKVPNAAAQISAVMKDLDFGSKCSGFATPTGFGTWGKAVIQELVAGNANSLLQGTEDLRRACPNYDFLTIPQKSHVWVNVLASMSFLESSCDPGVVGKGPDGKAAGILQLHAGHEHKAAPGCSRNDSRSPITSLKCTISIIETQIKRTSLLFSRDTHFGVLRPQGDLIRTRSGALKRIVKARIVVGGLKELPFCQRQ